MAERIHNHYFKDVSKLQTIDVYRVLSLFNVTDPCIQHAVKKLLVAGGRGAGKDVSKDIQEAIDSLNRWAEMRQEDAGEVAAQTSDFHGACDRIYDLLLGNDAQAFKEARRYLEKKAPELHSKLMAAQTVKAIGLMASPTEFD